MAYAQAELRVRQVRGQRDGAPVVAGRVRQVAGQLEGKAEVPARLGVARAQRHGAAQQGQPLRLPPGLRAQHAQPVQRLEMPGDGGEDVAIALLGRRQIAVAMGERGVVEPVVEFGDGRPRGHAAGSSPSPSSSGRSVSGSGRQRPTEVL